MDVSAASIAWSYRIRIEKPIPKASSYLAASVARAVERGPPVAMDGLVSTWCMTSVCGGDLALITIVGPILHHEA